MCNLSLFHSFHVTLNAPGWLNWNADEFNWTKRRNAHCNWKFRKNGISRSPTVFPMKCFPYLHQKILRKGYRKTSPQINRTWEVQRVRWKFVYKLGNHHKWIWGALINTIQRIDSEIRVKLLPTSNWGQNKVRKPYYTTLENYLKCLFFLNKIFWKSFFLLFFLNKSLLF